MFLEIRFVNDSAIGLYGKKSGNYVTKRDILRKDMTIRQTKWICSEGIITFQVVILITTDLKRENQKNKFYGIFLFYFISFKHKSRYALADC